MRSSAIKTTILLVVLASIVPAQTKTTHKATRVPAPLEFLQNENGEPTITIPFSVRVSPGFFTARTEFAIKSEASSFRILTTWEPNAPVTIQVSGPAGHGLPGRVSLFSQQGQSPLTVEFKISPEQAARGSIYLEVSSAPFERDPKSIIHGTMVVSRLGEPEGKADEEERIGNALEEGKLLSLSEVKALEQKVKEAPHDWTARLSLLAYYSSSAGLHMTKQRVVEARRRHILWAIENRAEADQIFDQAVFQIDNHGPLADPEGVQAEEQAFQEAIAKHGKTTAVLRNATFFFANADPDFSEKTALRAKLLHEQDVESWNAILGWLYGNAIASGTDKVFAEHARNVLKVADEPIVLGFAATRLGVSELNFRLKPVIRAEISRSKNKNINLAEEYAVHAIALAPENSYWLVPLLLVLTVEVEIASTPEEKLVTQKKVYGLFQQFDSMNIGPTERTLLLPGLASIAFDIKDDKGVKLYAMQALDLASQQGDAMIEGVVVGPQAIHDANDVLGRLALRNGNLQMAKEYLMKAAQTSGGGKLATQGPRMMLAQALLEHGEREIVVQYLEKMRTPWKNGSYKIDRWIDAVRKGKTPRLNLVDVSILVNGPG